MYPTRMAEWRVIRCIRRRGGAMVQFLSLCARLRLSRTIDDASREQEGGREGEVLSIRT